MASILEEYGADVSPRLETPQAEDGLGRRPGNPMRPLQLLLALSLVGPVLLFAYAATVNYRVAFAEADDQVQRTLDVVEEQALKIFEVDELALRAVNQMIGTRSDDELRSDEKALHEQLAAFGSRHVEAKDLWVLGRDGHPLASSAVYPEPAAATGGDRDFFLAHRDAKIGTYVGSVIHGRMVNADFFSLSRRREGADGGFNGVVSVSLFPRDFTGFYERFAHATPLLLALVRADGAILARYPEIGAEKLEQGADAAFTAFLHDHPTEGLYAG